MAGSLEMMECEHCGKELKGKSALTLHIRRDHEGMKINRSRTPRGKTPSYGGSRPPVANWKDKFIDAFRQTGMVTEACKITGISRAHFYKTCQKDPVFAELVDDTKERETEILEAVARKRAVDGSDGLMIFLLKARRPEIYRENIHHDHSHVVTGHIGVGLINGHEPIEFASAKRREAARLLLEEENISDAVVVEAEEAA